MVSVGRDDGVLRPEGASHANTDGLLAAVQVTEPTHSLHSTAQYSTATNNSTAPAQHSTVQYSTVQYSTVQYSTATNNSTARLLIAQHSYYQQYSTATNSSTAQLL